MIWFILGLLPFALLFLVAVFDEPVVVVVGCCLWAACIGLILLSAYGAWEMNWFPHCGSFWAYCGG